MASEFTIREARAEDCEEIIRLIQELADYEKMPEGPRINADRLRQDGFGDNKYFHCYVADGGDKLVGYALYFYIYSTWEGASVYLEDLYVSPEYRNKGLGVGLWKTVAKEAVSRDCARLDWCCLCWNTPSIEFYKAKGAVNITEKDGWNVFRLTGDSLKQFAA